MAFEYASEQGGLAEATVMGAERHLLPAVNAAFCNGISGHALELDDIHTESSLHPGVVVVPTALAACERAGADGETLLKAVVLGYEVMTRMGMAIDPKAHYARGFHPTATCGCFGALAAAGYVFGLSFQEFLNGYGIAASMASGLLEFSYSGSWVKRFQVGWAAHSGVTAAILAKKGFTGSPTAITGRYGFLRSHSDTVHPEALSEALGETYEVSRTQIKYFACCTYQHAALTGVIQMIKEREFRAGDVARIDIGVVEPALRLTYEPREAKVKPQSIVDAQFSLPYGVAVCVLFGNASINEYNETLLQDASVLELAGKVYVRYEPELDKYYPKYFPAKVEITLNSGERLQKTVTSPKGYPDNPLSDVELEDKFGTLAGRVFQEDRVKVLLEAVRTLETVEDLRSFARLLGT